MILKDAFTPVRCRLCFDKFNVLSDIACGDGYGAPRRSEGTSALLVRTQAGEEALEQVRDCLALKEAEPEAVLRHHQKRDMAGYLAAFAELCPGVRTPLPEVCAKSLGTPSNRNRARYLRELRWHLRFENVKDEKQAHSMARTRLLRERLQRILRSLRGRAAQVVKGLLKARSSLLRASVAGGLEARPTRTLSKAGCRQVNEASQERSRDDKPLVSVIMAAYNCQEYVGEAIESILAQTYENWELICVDDASTDRTRAIVARYAEANDRIKLLCNAENLGPAATRNVALKHAKGEFLAVLDADDVALPDRLERSLEAFGQDPALGLVAGVYETIGRDGRTLRRLPAQAWDASQIRNTLLTEGPPFGHSSIMVRRALLDLIGGYDEAMPVAQDYDMYLRLLPHCKFAKLQTTLVKWRQHPDSLTANKPVTQKMYAEFARARARARGKGVAFNVELELEHVRQVTTGQRRFSRKAAWCAFKLGIGAIALGQPHRARQLLRQALRYWPLFPRALVCYLITFAPRTAQMRAASFYKRVEGRLSREAQRLLWSAKKVEPGGTQHPPQAHE